MSPDIKSNQRKLKKIILICVLIVAVIFAAMTTAWFIRYNVLIKPLLSNEKLERSQYDEGNSFIEGCSYEFNDSTESYSAHSPGFLNYTGNFQYCTATELDKVNDEYIRITDITYSVMYFPQFFGRSYYTVEVNDMTDLPKSETMGDGKQSVMIVYSDDLSLCRESKPGAYDKYYDEIKMLHNKFVDFYGEENVR